MKKVLIIASGDFARHFLNRIYKSKDVIHEYFIIAKDSSCVPEGILGMQNFSVEIFDPTSIERLKLVVNQGEFDRCIMIMDIEFDARVSLNNLKEIAPNLEIYLADFWDLVQEYKEEKHIKILNVLSLNSSRFMGCLPDSPVFAQYVGLGRGEIMEVKIPVGSSFAYRKVGTLSSKRYKIPMIYRHNTYIITTKSTVIYPNDTILVVGEPSALRAVFAQVKQQNGQFPSPFGINIYALIDMKEMNESSIYKTLRAVEYLDSRLQNHKICIRVVNPKISPSFEEIKAKSDDEKFEILIDYKEKNISNLNGDVSENKAGLVVCVREIFEKNKAYLQSLGVPILSLGQSELDAIKRSVVVNGGANMDEESSVVFDISSQLGMNIHLYIFNENGGKGGEFVQNYLNLSKLFSKELIIHDDMSKNPLIELSSESDFLQFVPFSDKILAPKSTAIFKKDLDKMYFKLSHNHQIFLPCDMG
ncbi:potassium transporter TrkA [Campylobacter sp. VBCF_05 NA6]|uniref:TrkA C-terminal domain-containing protein n=1 Tax=unclassified Campylobacter TaxID=2593542 RepID=UPI0022E9EBED|nr:MULTISPECIES: TrkA C-terminal domain-containing protein [unclassified Campylobacter]MDA3058305.1 potassium transporter TrkA [Campylobacter sp. VBCF_04 NA7]MDA3059875.1 potassium transporter TrkA [Campylobacter sp. VBCF_05 NA6]